MRLLFKRPSFVQFSFAVLLVLLAWWETTTHLWQLVWTVDAFSHGIWVPAVTLWLIHQKRRDLLAVSMSFWRPGAIIIAAFTATWILGEAAQARVIQHIALVGMINGLAVTLLGPAAFRIVRFPMFFLFLMIPVGEGLVGPLQVLTAKAVIGALSATGIDFTADGVLIKLSGGLYQVARACAGVKFFFTSMVLGVLLSHLVFTSWRRRLAFLLFAGMMPIIGNIVRVYTTILIAEWSGQAFGKGVDHILYGWGFLSIILVLQIALAYRFSDKPATPVAAGEAQPQAENDKFYNDLVTKALVVMMPVFAGIWAIYIMQPAQQIRPVCDRYTYEVATVQGGDVRSLTVEEFGQHVPRAGADAMIGWSYRLHANVIEGTTGVYGPDRPGHRAQSVPFSYLGEGWEQLDGLDARDRMVEDIPFSETIVWLGSRRKLVWQTYFVGGRFVSSDLDMKIALGFARLTGKSADVQSLSIAAEIQNDSLNTREILHKFLREIPPGHLLWQPAADGKEGLCAA